jgi:hypothetical protein
LIAAAWSQIPDVNGASRRLQFAARVINMHPCDGTVLRVASDAQHAFSKPLRQRITLIEGHGVEGDAHAGEYIRHRFIARVRPRQPNRPFDPRRVV